MLNLLVYCHGICVQKFRDGKGGLDILLLSPKTSITFERGGGREKKGKNEQVLGTFQIRNDEYL